MQTHIHQFNVWIFVVFWCRIAVQAVAMQHCLVCCPREREKEWESKWTLGLLWKIPVKFIWTDERAYPDRREIGTAVPCVVCNRDIFLANGEPSHQHRHTSDEHSLPNTGENSKTINQMPSGMMFILRITKLQKTKCMWIDTSYSLFVHTTNTHNLNCEM